MHLYRTLLRRYRPEAFRTTRRDFIRLGASAGLLVLDKQAALGLPVRRRYGGRVIVAGAGLAGLSCAYELRRAGYEVQILEARPRIGGRVLTLRNWVPGKTVECGGELIGANHPMWARYARLFGLSFRLVTEWPDETRPVLIDGRLLQEAEKRALFEDMERVLGALTRQSADIDAERPWASANVATLDSVSLGDWLEQQRPTDLAARVMAVELGADNGVAVQRQSLLGMMTQIKGGGLEKYWTDTESYRAKQGSDALARAFLAHVGADRVHLRTAVTQIAWRDDGVEVCDASGKQWNADHVVLTVPPSVWGAVAFQPALPNQLAPQMGVNYKYISRLRGEAWRPFSPESLAEGPISETWDGTDRQVGPGRALIGFAGGPGAEAGVQRHGAEGDRAFTGELATLFPKLPAQFVEGRFIEWPRDPWLMAGYSSAAPGQITVMGKTLYDGIGRLQFAGEHTCYKFPGYMEGALQSGVRAARNIATLG